MNMQHLQIKTLQQQQTILKIEIDKLREALDAAKEENKRLQERKIELEEDCRELRRRIEESGSTCSKSKIKTKFTQEEKERSMRYDP